MVSWIAAMSAGKGNGAVFTKYSAGIDARIERSAAFCAGNESGAISVEICFISGAGK